MLGYAIAAVIIYYSVFVFLELYLRRQFIATNIDRPELNNILLYSAPIEKKPYAEISFRFYGRNAEPIYAADITLNNMGYFSRRTYDCARGTNEFRIVVLGGEQTASSIVDTSWPDHLEEELNRRGYDVRYRVFNLAWPDAGPEHYLKFLNAEGIKFDPDLVIVNFVETDFRRTLKGAPPTYKGYPIGHSAIEYRLGPSEADIARTMTANVLDRSVQSYRDPNAVPARPYGFFASREFIDNRAKIAALQETIARDMVAGAVPPFGQLLLRFALGMEWRDVHRLRNFDPVEFQPVDNEELVRFGVANFGALAAVVPNVIFTHNFNPGELRIRFEVSEKVFQQLPNVVMIDMRKVMPQVSEDEINSWYCVPHMVEKWSALGHEIYASMMADVVLNYRRRRTSTSGSYRAFVGECASNSRIVI